MRNMENLVRFIKQWQHPHKFSWNHYLYQISMHKKYDFICGELYKHIQTRKNDLSPKDITFFRFFNVLLLTFRVNKFWKCTNFLWTKSTQQTRFFHEKQTTIKNKNQINICLTQRRRRSKTKIRVRFGESNIAPIFSYISVKNIQSYEVIGSVWTMDMKEEITFLIAHAPHEMEDERWNIRRRIKRRKNLSLVRAK